MSHSHISHISFPYRWYHVVFFFIVCVRLETGYKIFCTDVLDFSKQRYFEQKWIILTLRTKYLQSLQASKSVQEENCEWMFYHIPRGINNTHESPQGIVKLHEILYIFKQIYRGQCKVSNKNCEWVWDPPCGVLSSLGNVQDWWCSSVNMLLLSS